MDPQTCMFLGQREKTEIMGEVFATRSVSRSYNQDQLAVEVSQRERENMFMREKHIFSSERMLHKAYDSRSSIYIMHSLVSYERYIMGLSSQH
jgi:hypothetical protein